MATTWVKFIVGVVSFACFVSTGASDEPSDTAASATRSNSPQSPSTAIPRAFAGGPPGKIEGPKAGATSNPNAMRSDSAPLAKDSKAARAEAIKKRDALPAPNDKNATPVTKALRDLFDKRVTLLNDWDDAVKEREKAEHPDVNPEKQSATLDADLERTKATLQKALKEPSSVIPAVFRGASGRALSDAERTAMKDAIQAAQNDFKDWSDKLEKGRSESSNAGETRLATLRADRNNSHLKVVAAKARRAELQAAIASANSKEAKEFLIEQLINLEWELCVDSERLMGQEALIALEEKTADRDSLAIELAKTHVELAKLTLEGMQKCYRELATKQENDLEKAAASEEKRAGKLSDPLERYRARRTADLLELEARVLKGETAVAASQFSSPDDEREKADQAASDYAQIKKLLQDGRVSHLDALRLNNDFRRIGPERDRIIKNELASVTERLTLIENSLSSVELSLINDPRDDRFELEALLETLPKARHPQANALFDELERKHIELLQKRKKYLERLAVTAEEIHTQIQRRLHTLEEQYGFIQTHIFWVRDQEPIGLISFTQAEREGVLVVKSLMRLKADLVDSSAWGKTRIAFLILAGFLGVVPWPFFRLQCWLGGYRHGHCVSRMTAQELVCILYGILSALIWPLYVVLIAVAAWQAPWPRGMALIAVPVISVLAAVLASYNIGRWTLRPGGWAEAVLRLPPDVSQQLRRAFMVLVIGATVLLLPSNILKQGLLTISGRPVTASSISRLLDLSFGLVIWTVVFFLRRSHSPLVEWLVHSPQCWGWVYQRRRTLSGALLAFITAAVALDGLGYSFTAHRLGAGALQSMVVVAVCFGIYRLLLRAIDHQAWRWVRADQSPTQSGAVNNALSEPTDLPVRLRRLSGYLVPVLGLAMCAWIWGIDWSLFHYLGELRVFRAGVTVGEITEAVLVVLLTAAIWRHMHTFFEVIVFPRVSDDPGIRFAVLTLCRYLVLGMGLLIALSAVHLGPSQIGLALATLGVGIGFGLQEVISNFVCGIILLLERPIRVGDIVTVNGMSGQVDRINIRATTINNGDNQSMIVPNRAFITGDVVNWTLKDKILHTSIRVKVAHGNDPDRVSDLLLKIAFDDPDVLRNPVPVSLLVEFGDSYLTFALDVHVPDPSLVGRVKHRLLGQVQRRFKDSGIEIPIPSQEFIVKPVGDSALSFFSGPNGNPRVDHGTIATHAPHRYGSVRLPEETVENRCVVDE